MEEHLSPDIRWNVPYQRNPFFIGRDELLAHLHAQWQTAQAIPQVLTGLGGIGKTSVAIEYAYRYKQEYEAVLWARADTMETLTASYTTIASLLKLDDPIKEGIIHWLQTHSAWLLILDNVQDLARLQDFLPVSSTGHILITTRVGDPHLVCFEVETLPDETGALFLLWRAGLLEFDAPFSQALPDDQTQAQKISRELGGLPLALDQAGAFLEACGGSLSEYLSLYQGNRRELLGERYAFAPDHPDPVAATWLLSFQQVAARNAAAVELLRLLAFLAPDAIGEELLLQGKDLLGPILSPVIADRCQFERALEALQAQSLITRDPVQQTLSLHRLVQVVIRDTLSDAAQQEWKQRAIQILNAGFPQVRFETWTLCERALAHAFQCVQWIEEEQIVSQEAVHLLNRLGYYLTVRARYLEAEPILKQACATALRELGEMHPNTATSLNILAYLYEQQGKYEEAEPLYQQALAIREQLLGETHPSTATSLSNLALLQTRLGRWVESQPLLQRALIIREQQLGLEHPRTATSLNNMGYFFRGIGAYAMAFSLYQQALSIREQSLGESHPDTASSLNNLGVLADMQHNYAQASSLLQRALTIRFAQLGENHPDTAMTLHNLASVCQHQGRKASALSFYQQALLARLQCLGAAHPDTQTTQACLDALSKS